MRFDRSAVELKCFRALCAAVLTAAFGFAAPAAATPVFSDDGAVSAPAGALIALDAESSFDNAGTNPRFTAADFTTTAYYSRAEVDANGTLWVQAKTADQLNAMTPPPDTPFTVDADVTMTNDEGETASGTITFSTAYERSTTASPPPAPTMKSMANVNAPPGEKAIVSVTDVFDNAGTNPRFIGFGGDTTYVADFDYHPVAMVDESEAFFVTVKTARQLNAMTPRPASPFTIQLDVSMTNDEDQAASGAVTFETRYAKVKVVDGVVVTPTLKLIPNTNAPYAEEVTVSVTDLFADAGTNPRFTSMTGGSNYVARYGFHPDKDADESGSVFVMIKTGSELRAMTPPPDSSFTTRFDVAMTNDEGQTASGAVTFETTRPAVRVVDGEAVAPTLKSTGNISAAPGVLVTLLLTDIFEDAGTNPTITLLDFGSEAVLDRFSEYGIRSGESEKERNDRFYVQAKTSARLNELSPLLPSPFTTPVTVTMSNDEGQTASGTVTFETTYDRVEPAADGG